MKQIINSIKEFFKSTKDNKIGKAIFAILMLLLGITTNILLCLNLQKSTTKVLKNHEEVKYYERVKKEKKEASTLATPNYVSITLDLHFDTYENYEKFFYCGYLVDEDVKNLRQFEFALNLTTRSHDNEFYDYLNVDINAYTSDDNDIYLADAIEFDIPETLIKGENHVTIYICDYDIHNYKVLKDNEQFYIIKESKIELFKFDNDNDNAPIYIENLKYDFSTDYSNNVISGFSMYEFDFYLISDWTTQNNLILFDCYFNNFLNRENYYSNKLYRFNKQLNLTNFKNQFSIKQLQNVDNSLIGISNSAYAVNTPLVMLNETNSFYNNIFSVNTDYNYANPSEYDGKQYVSITNTNQIKEKIYYNSLGWQPPFTIEKPTYLFFSKLFNDTNICLWFVSEDDQPLTNIKNSLYYSKHYFETLSFFNDFIEKNFTMVVDNDASEAFNSGYQQGYEEGKREQAKINFSLTELIKTAFDGIQDFLNFEILPNLKLGYLILIPIVFKLVHFVFGWFR